MSCLLASQDMCGRKILCLLNLYYHKNLETRTLCFSDHSFFTVKENKPQSGNNANAVKVKCIPRYVLSLSVYCLSKPCFCEGSHHYVFYDCDKERFSWLVCSVCNLLISLCTQYSWFFRICDTLQKVSWLPSHGTSSVSHGKWPACITCHFFSSVVNEKGPASPRLLYQDNKDDVLIIGEVAVE